MTRFRLETLATLFALLLALGSMQGCRERDSVQIVNVSLRNTESYQYATVGGDEEGARVSTQAQHYSLSEIRRNAATHFVATYVYQSAAGFIGTDDSEIEVLTGSDGASPPKNIKRIAFHFVIHE
jgi:hypothetical protein